MKRFAFFLILPLCFVAYGCMSVEQEIFLNPDGSGQLSLGFSIPDYTSFPKEDHSGAGVASPEEALAKIKAEVREALPPGVALKEAKEVRQNGLLSFYVILEFKDAKSLGELSSSWSKLGSRWSLRIEKGDRRTNLTGEFYFDAARLSRAAQTGKTEEPLPKYQRPESGRAKGAEPATSDLEQLMMGALFRFRLALYAPAPIVETNADIVLNQRIAIWNFPLVSKSPLQVKASY